MSRRSRQTSATSEDTQQSKSRYRQDSATNTIAQSVISEATSVRSNSPAPSEQSSSERSVSTSGKPFDTVSLATTAQTGYTNTTAVTANTSVSQQQQPDTISASQTTGSQQQLPHTNTGVANQPTPPNTTATHQQQQPRFDVAKALFTQADTNRDGSLSRQEFTQWIQSGSETGGQHQQNAQFGAGAVGDTTLLIDYSAIEAYNIGYQSAGDITAEQLSAGGSKDGGQKFDVFKALFNQVDTNRDGSISRQEFGQWADRGQQNYGGQANSQSGANLGNNNINHTALFAGANPEVANILRQSGLGQGL